MKAGKYIAVPTPSGPLIMQVEGLMPSYAVLLSVDTGEQIFYAQGSFFKGLPAHTLLKTCGEWIEVPEFLETQVRSNSMLEWAQTKFNERAFHQAEGQL